MFIPNDILNIHSIFKKNKFELYVVGGAVRDYLLKIKPNDYDLVTNAYPDEIINLLKSENNFSIKEVGKSFGVILVSTRNFPEGIEIATFREDIGKGKNTKVKFSTIDKDVLRRDITINALFYDIDNNKVVDLVGGINDIENRIIRTVGDADCRFNEDRLRILRSLRFASKYNFALDRYIIESIKKDNNLNQISKERIMGEFKKTLKNTDNKIAYLNMLNDFKLWDIMFPGIIVNKQFTNLPWITQIAYLFMSNTKDKLSTVFTKKEVCTILLLKELINFKPIKILDLYKKRNNVTISNNDIYEFAVKAKIDKNIINAFIKFKPTVNSKDIIEKYSLQGSDITKKINEIESNNFIKLLI